MSAARENACWLFCSLVFSAGLLALACVTTGWVAVTGGVSAGGHLLLAILRARDLWEDLG